MGFGFGKKKKNISSDTTPAAADIKTTLDDCFQKLQDEADTKAGGATIQ